jgi:hypothetical protein
MLLDIYIVFKYLSNLAIVKDKQISGKAKFSRIAFILLWLLAFAPNISAKMDYEGKYITQINNQLKGPLDYTIPYIKENYKKPEDLVLATDYEELSYIFYLDCRIVLGYTNKNLKQDLTYTPDLMIFRKQWGHNPKYFNEYFQRAKYNRISFPVFDAAVNNITELDFVFPHYFETRMAANDNEKADILVKAKE